MREQLPTQPDERHCWDDVRWFDQYRDGYAEAVTHARRHASERVWLPDSEAAALCTGMYKTMDYNDYRDGHLMTLAKSRIEPRQLTELRQDVITACYFPSSLSRVKLYLHNTHVGEWNIAKPKPLVDILQEARTVPHRTIPLEELLTLARSGKELGYVHHPHATITLDGVEYTRLEMVQPVMHNNQMHREISGIYVTISFRVAASEPCTFWIESGGSIKMPSSACFYVDGHHRSSMIVPGHYLNREIVPVPNATPPMPPSVTGLCCAAPRPDLPHTNPLLDGIFTSLDDGYPRFYPIPDTVP